MDAELVSREVAVGTAIGALLLVFIGAWFGIERLLERTFNRRTMAMMERLPEGHHAVRDCRAALSGQVTVVAAPPPLAEGARQYAAGLRLRLAAQPGDAEVLEAVYLFAWSLGREGYVGAASPAEALASAEQARA
jgi:hypothetical protein